MGEALKDKTRDQYVINIKVSRIVLDEIDDASCDNGRKQGVRMNAAALRFSLANPAVAAVIAGACRPHRIAEDISALNEVMPADFWHEPRRAELVSARAPPSL